MRSFITCQLEICFFFLGNRKPKTAPDITNAMAFPSLSDSQSSTPTGAWGRKKGTR